MYPDISGLIVTIFVFIIIAACCCSSDSGNSENTASKRSTPVKKSTYTPRSRSSYAYCECPSCGAPYYDGYCEECGYPDINQGWLGEEYG